MRPLQLHNGQFIPPVGFGTWEVSPNNRARALVSFSLQAGYRLIDTAKLYGNEQGIGEAIAASDIPREDLFITSKVWNDDQGYDETITACEASLQRLGLGYLDLYLIHWPATPQRHDSWRALEDLYKDGRIKAAGVSNYTVRHLQELMDRSGLVPMVNQVEFHPFIYEDQKPLLDFCEEQGILIEAYSPIRRLDDASSSALHAIAKKHGKSPQQVSLRWCIEHGTVPLPRSTNSVHLADNLRIFDFELDEADMNELDSMTDGKRVTWDPSGMGG